MSELRNSGTGPVLIMAGGTGGHVFPALAVADELVARGLGLVWLGTRGGPEQGWLHGRDIPLELVYAGGLRGGNWWQSLRGLLRCALGALQSLRVILRHRPAVALGMGGYASVPGAVAAWLLRVPLCIHEQNAVPGLANRVLARLAARCLQAYPHSLPGAETIGNPVRAALQGARPVTAMHRRQHFHLLVLGGSQGAACLNRILPEALWRIAAQLPLSVLHQAGPARLEDTRQHYRGLPAKVQIEGFIADMVRAYRWADLAVCRAGALTLAELNAVGLAAILVPYMHADSHQLQNARFLSDRGGAVLVPEPELCAERLATVLLSLATDRKRLVHMAGCSRRLARPDAAARIAEVCLQLCRPPRQPPSTAQSAPRK